MNINCIFSHKKINMPYSSAIDEYTKRLQRYCKIKLLPFKKFEKNSTGKKVIYISSGHSNYPMPSSEELSEYIGKSGLQGIHELNFVMSEIPQEAEEVFSLCHAELNPDMLTVLLTEQIYRAFRILHNHSYHK